MMFEDDNDENGGPGAPPWGTAATSRGMRHHDAAVAFLAAYPIGSVLSADAFGEWLVHYGLIEAPTDTRKDCDAWIAHLHRRNQIKKCINKAASHRRMSEQGLQPYAVMGKGLTLEVLATHVAIQKANVGARIPKFVRTVRRQLNELMQSTEWAKLPPYERIFAESLFSDTNTAEKIIEIQCAHLDDKYIALAKKLKKLNIALPSPEQLMREEQEEFEFPSKFDDDADPEQK